MYAFFAYLSRMRHIRRWSLMRNTQTENIQEHSLQVGMIAHGLALIANREYGASLDAEHILTLAVYHEAAEVITGDLPTPIKYFSPALRSEYGQIEQMANERLMAMLPETLQADYGPLLDPTQDEAYRYVKAADKLCAYLKCVEELKSGNAEFSYAAQRIREDIDTMAEELPAVAYFMKTFEPDFHLTLDELNR